MVYELQVKKNYILSKKVSMKLCFIKIIKLSNILNSRIESDIPVPYGRTVAISKIQEGKKNIIVPKFDDKRRDILITTLLNDCPKDRVRTMYINELQKYLKVDIYGECGDELKNA